MSTRKILVLSVFCLLIAAEFSAAAEEKVVVFGGKKGWPQLETMKNITTGKGRYGYTCMQLATNARQNDSSTDLLISFDDKKMFDASGNYAVTANALTNTPHAIMGNGAALSRGERIGLKLAGREGSIFGTSGTVGSFSIEFWLSPSIAENGEVVFSWQSSRSVNDYPVYQMITASFFNNHLEWKFTNVFEGYAKNEGEVSLISRKTIIPDEWTHHVISFDEENGLLEYRIDGQVEALEYLTDTGHQYGTVFAPILGVPADIEICPQYTGSIDDFRIRRPNMYGQNRENVQVYSKYDTYQLSGGRFVTRPILVSRAASFTSLDAVLNEPAQTAVRLYVRSGDNQFVWNDTTPEWIPVKPGEKITGVTGLYFQVAADLFPDGAGKVTPSVTELTLHFDEQPAPYPPFSVAAKAGNGCVTLTWSYSVDDTTGGYLVYYGTRPGEYLGDAAVEGPSPVDVGNTVQLTLTGLQNGTIYYFAIASYSRVDRHISGVLSKEVYARPFAGRSSE